MKKTILIEIISDGIHVTTKGMNEYEILGALRYAEKVHFVRLLNAVDIQDIKSKEESK